MFRWFPAVVDYDVARLAMWATQRRCNIDAEIVLNWRFMAPTNMPNGCNTFARSLLLATFTAFIVFRFRFLLAGRDFDLSFEPKFKLGLLQRFLKTQNFLD